MELARKLQVRPGSTVALIAVPDDVHLDLSDDLATADPLAADVVIAFVTRAADLDMVAAPALEAGRGDRVAWIACPKAK